MSKKNIGWHFLFWMGYLVLNNLAWYSFDSGYSPKTCYGIIPLPLKLCAVYINALFLFPKLFLEKKYVRYLVSTSILIGLSAFIQLQALHVGHLILGLENLHFMTNFTWTNLLQQVIPILTLLIFSSIVLLLEQFYVKEAESEKLKKENTIAELNFLRSQINPHFLFNTLNNLYSLSLKNSTSTSKSILMLSDFLRYHLYETQAKLVCMQTEIEYVKKYMELERLRFGEEVSLSINIFGPSEDKLIPPLLLIPLVENAFKHKSEDSKGDLWISLWLTVSPEHLTLLLENSCQEISTSEANRGNGGIGLYNIQRRLELIFQDNFELETTRKQDKFSVFLKIPVKPVAHGES